MARPSWQPHRPSLPLAALEPSDRGTHSLGDRICLALATMVFIAIPLRALAQLVGVGL